jgi:hypothetical protein
MRPEPVSAFRNACENQQSHLVWSGLSPKIIKVIATPDMVSEAGRSVTFSVLAVRHGLAQKVELHELIFRGGTKWIAAARRA